MHAGLDQAGQLAVVGLFIVVAMAPPFLLIRRGPAALRVGHLCRARARSAAVATWPWSGVARLLIQVAGSILFAYMFYCFGDGRDRRRA